MQCCVKDCGNDNIARNISKHRITFHTFPKDPNLRAAWIQSLSLPDSTPITNKTVVCSDHFLEEEFYDTRCKVRRLKTGVVPLIRNDINAPIATRVCKICLALDAKMYHLKDHNLAQMYIDVVGIPPRTHAEGRLPQQVCWECRARLTSAAALKAKAILSDALLNDQALKIGYILKIHQKHASLKSSLSRGHVQELFDTEHIDDIKSSSNSKTELADIPFNDEFEIEVNQLLTDKIQIKDEKNNVMIEEILESDHNAVKTEVDLVPIADIVIPEDNIGFDDVNFSDDEATETYMETDDNTQATVIELTSDEDIESTATNDSNINYNKHKIENNAAENIVNEDVIMVSDEEKFVIKDDIIANILNKNLQRDQTEINSAGAIVCLDKIDIPVVKKTAPKKVTRRPKLFYTIDEKIFTITYLSREAMIQEVLSRQNSSKYKQAPFKCTVCFRGFPTSDIQTRHMIRHSEKSGPFKCEICKFRFKKKRKISGHIKQAHTVEYTCKLCPFVTRGRDVAVGHMKFHAGSTYKCPHCGLEFEKQTTLLGHKRLKHMSDCVCELCGYTFVSTSGVRIHKVFTHKNIDKNVELVGPYCEVCDVKFLSESAYDRHLGLSSKHIKSEHDPNRLINNPSSKSRNIHFQAIKTVDRGPGIRRRHEDTVTSHKGVTCEQCGLVLENLRVYARHFKSDHPDVKRTQFGPKIFPLMCEQCGKMFKDSTLFAGHMSVHTGKRRFQCDHCNRTFSMKTILRSHMRIHEESRPSFPCHECGKLFTFPTNLTRHMFLHTGLKPFKCDACDKGFPTSGELRAHVDHVHLKKPRPKRIRIRAKKTKKEDV